MFFEDIVIGERRDLGTHSFSAEEIMDFARRYDPQRFHTDPQTASETIFGGLIASGWHTVAVWMRMMVRDRLNAEAVAPAISPGFADLRWSEPCAPARRCASSAKSPASRIGSRGRPSGSSSAAMKHATRVARCSCNSPANF